MGRIFRPINPSQVVDYFEVGALVSLYGDQVNELANNGFPLVMLTAFNNAANQNIQLEKDINITATVIMSRVPGKAARNLINQGYDVKGFNIKAKSCDWGPMMGFVCKLAPFNKKGVDQMLSNGYENYKYRKKQKSNPFEPIVINEKRLTEIINQKKIKILYSEGSNQFGYSFNGDKIEDSSVYLQFMIQKKVIDNTILYDLFHGLILIKNDNKWIEYKDGSFQSLLLDEVKNDQKYKKFADEIGNSEFETILQEVVNSCKIDKIQDVSIRQEKKNGYTSEDSLKTIKGNIDTYFKNSEIYIYYKIEGIKNPQNNNKKNRPSFLDCVTGDYDTFSFWIQGYNTTNPKALDEIYIRESEKYHNGRDKKVGKEKVFTIKLDTVWLEFVPHFDEIEEQEDLLLGNYNLLGAKVSNHINYLSSQLFDYNRVYHSDEQGRPGVNDIEFPIALFNPVKIVDNEIKRFDLISDLNSFLEYLIKLRDKLKGFPITLNFGWVIYFFAATFDTVSVNDPSTPERECCKLYFKKYHSKTFKTLTKEESDKYKLLLIKLLFRGVEMSTDQNTSFNGLRDKFIQFIEKPNQKSKSKIDDVKTLLEDLYESLNTVNF